MKDSYVGRVADASKEVESDQMQESLMDLFWMGFDQLLIETDDTLFTDSLVEFVGLSKHTIILQFFSYAYTYTIDCWR